MASRVIVSYEPEPKHRDDYVRLLDKPASVEELTFLSDVPDAKRAQVLAEADVMLTWNIVKELKPEEFPLLATLRLLQLVTAGADHLPFRLLPAGPVIASNVGAYAPPMAEHVAAMTLSLAKRLVVNHLKMKEKGEFDQSTKNRMVRGLVCGIVGFGGIGKAVAQIMRALGLKIWALNTSGKTDEPVDFIGPTADLDHLLANADVVVLSLPLTTATRELIGKRELSLMKPEAILVNVARGAVIDPQALYEHLKNNPGFSAAIDTWWVDPATHGKFLYDYPFFDLPNFLGSPHNSPVVPGVMKAATRQAAENVLRFLAGEGARGMLRREDYPES